MSATTGTRYVRQVKLRIGCNSIAFGATPVWPWSKSKKATPVTRARAHSRTWLLATSIWRRRTGVACLSGMVDRLSTEGFSGWYVHGILTATSAMFRFAVRRDLVESNPVRLERGDRPPTKRRQEPRYLSRDEIDRLLAELSDGFRPVAAVCAFAGLRVSEALALRWQDVDFATSMLSVPGTKTEASTQPVPMTSALADELRAHRGRHPGVGEALLFTQADGQPRRRHAVANAVRVAGDRAGLNPPGAKKVAPHDLRHSCAGLLFAAGVPAPKVAAILRHASPRITLTVYAGLVESQRAELRDDLETALA